MATGSSRYGQHIILKPSPDVLPGTDQGWGEIGSPIPNSKYVRGYCVRCGEPMRILPVNSTLTNYCEECDPPDRGRASLADARPVPSRVVEDAHWAEYPAD